METNPLITPVKEMVTDIRRVMDAGKTIIQKSVIRHKSCTLVMENIFRAFSKLLLHVGLSVEIKLLFFALETAVGGKKAH